MLSYCVNVKEKNLAVPVLRVVRNESHSVKCT